VQYKKSIQRYLDVTFSHVSFHDNYDPKVQPQQVMTLKRWLEVIWHQSYATVPDFTPPSGQWGRLVSSDMTSKFLRPGSWHDIQLSIKQIWDQKMSQVSEISFSETLGPKNALIQPMAKEVQLLWAPRDAGLKSKILFPWIYLTMHSQKCSNI
jgi:hypothetical protein